jgi:hypothetical protein
VGVELFREADMMIFFAVYTPFLLFALFLQFSAPQIGKRRREAQTKYIAGYRKSRESQLLILND